MARSTIYKIYSDLVNAVKPIVGVKYVFLKDRPNTKDEDLPMSKFVVIDLPTPINDAVIGGNRTLLQTSGVIYAFTQSRSNNTLDVNAMGELVDSIVDAFPIDGRYIMAAHPQVMMRGSDGQGFQVTTISFDLYGKWRAFDK